MTDYVAGFLFSEDLSKVSLVRKNKPEFQKGLLNAIGGKIESDESPYDAMVREFKEETGVDFDLWDLDVILDGDGWKVHFFSGISDIVYDCKTMEEEDISLYDVDEFWTRTDLMSNLKTIMSIALDKSGICKPVFLTDIS